MTDQITVPKQTWDAMREALRQLRQNPALKYEHTFIDEALTAANAVSVEPQAQGEASEYARGFTDGMNEAPTGECWVRAIDEAMVGAHLGVADMGDDYGTAKEKLNALICWHVAVARDTQATEPAEKRNLYECTGCGHLYDERPSSWDCMENPGRTYNDWVATPAAPEAP